MLNEYLNARDQRHIQAGYERDFKKYELLPAAQGHRRRCERRHLPGAALVRRHRPHDAAEQVAAADVADPPHGRAAVRVERQFRPAVSRGEPARREISTRSTQLEQPLQPGEVLDDDLHRLAHDPRLSRRQRARAVRLQRHLLRRRRTSRRWATTRSSSSTIRAGAARRTLPALVEMAPRGDSVHSRLNLFTPNARLDHVSHRGQHRRRTRSRSRPAISSARGRRTTAATSSTAWARRTRWISSPICPARYATRKEIYSGAERAGESRGLLRSGTPVRRRRHAREPRAQGSTTSRRISVRISSRNTASWSSRATARSRSPSRTRFPSPKAIGFITRMVKPTDVDLTYFVTAHELAHQWWGHQLIGGEVQGSNMMSETLAQYSAYMVMQQKYGKDYMHKVLRHYLDRYLRGRAGETRHEPPLALVQRESVRVVREGRADHVHPRGLHRRGQGESRAAQFPHAVPLCERAQPGGCGRQHARRAVGGWELSGHAHARRCAARADAAGVSVSDR